jgi:hypothetical protein
MAINNGNMPRGFPRSLATPNWLVVESVSASGCRLAQTTGMQAQCRSEWAPRADNKSRSEYQRISNVMSVAQDHPRAQMWALLEMIRSGAE